MRAIILTVCFFLQFTLPIAAFSISTGPDAYGYRSTDSLEAAGPVFSFIDISTTGTRLTFVDPDALPAIANNADDGTAINISLSALNSGFGFPFYGRFFDTIHMSSNGFLHFQLGADSDSFSNQCPFTAGGPNGIISVIWDDLLLENPPSISRGGYVQTFSSCPYQQGGQDACAVFQWDNIDHFGLPTDSFDAQAVLYSSGNIMMLLPSGNPEAGSSSSTGIKDLSGNISLMHACNSANSLPPDYAVLFKAPSQESFSFENEPNEVSASASLLPMGNCGLGKIASPGDSDIWFSSNINAGSQLFAWVDTTAAQASDTSSLEILSSSGATIGFDTNSGPGNSSAVAGLALTEAGNLFMRIRELGDDAALNPYILSSIISRPGDLANESEPNDAAGTANTVRAAVMHGSATATDSDYFSFNANFGDVVSVVVDNDPERNGLITKSNVQIIGLDGSQVLAANDSVQLSQATGTGRVMTLAAGTYFVRVSVEAGSSDSSYALAVLQNCHSACSDSDGDLVCDAGDNCPNLANSDQLNTDEDSAGDACDLCPNDATKLNPALCGCGIAETDSNLNGAIDCLPTSELIARLKAHENRIKKLSLLPFNASASKKKADAKLRKAILAADKSLATFVGTVSTRVVLASSTVSVSKLHTKLSKSVKAMLKAGRYDFAKAKTAAIKAIQKLRSVLATGPF
ncbi:MAG: hypothetical protein K1X79_05560 [Oligoflexia bacterium]|nr:hypothetical protein [Oligoflexia bacterium]